MEHFQGGNTFSQFFKWKKISKDKVILDIIIDGDIQKLLRKQAIEEVANDTNTGYYSRLFTRRKKEGTDRTILNLKKFNENCTTEYYKMESIKNVINMLKPDMFLASIDIKDAFYSVLFHLLSGDRKYVRFVWKGKTYQFLAMPNLTVMLMLSEFVINFLNLYLLLYMNLVMNHQFMWMIVYGSPRHLNNILIIYSLQDPCYRNWDLSYTQQSLYLYQHKKITF